MHLDSLFIGLISFSQTNMHVTVPLSWISNSWNFLVDKETRGGVTEEIQRPPGRRSGIGDILLNSQLNYQYLAIPLQINQEPVEPGFWSSSSLLHLPFNIDRPRTFVMMFLDSNNYQPIRQHEQSHEEMRKTFVPELLPTTPSRVILEYHSVVYSLHLL